MASNVVEGYVSEFGYKPESLQKLMNHVKEKGISMKYSEVKRAFETMKKESKSTPNRDTIKSEATNLDVNTSTISIDLMPTPEAEEAQQKQENKENKNNENNKKTEQKQWTFDVVKATEAIQVFEKLHKKITINAEVLPQILEWANNNENKYGISMSELKQAYSQKKAFEAMDVPSNKKKRKKKTTKKAKKQMVSSDDIDIIDNKLDELIELKSMIDYCSYEEIKEILEMYIKEWNHDPLNAKQLINFIDEHGLIDKYKDVNFEILSKYFQQYEQYKQEIVIKNTKIKRNKNKNKVNLSEFNCRDVLNKYIKSHGEPKDSTMFWKYVLDLGFDIDFKQLDEEYNKARGVKKAKKKKVKITRTSKKLKHLYKKSKQ